MPGCHVLCEKPITPDTASLRGSIPLAARPKADRIVMETQNLRFNDQLDHHRSSGPQRPPGHDLWCDRCAVDRHRTQQVRRPQRPERRANPAGGAILDFLPHMAYLVLHFFGYPEVVDCGVVAQRQWGTADRL